jgi:capsular polysaccharide biosynthesis protein
LEYLTVEAQAKLFATAKVIVAPHGAGLSNLIFCKKGTKIIEIFPPTYTVPCFWIISQQLGLDQTCVKGMGVSEKSQDMKLDITELLQIITPHMAQDHKAKT